MHPSKPGGKGPAHLDVPTPQASRYQQVMAHSQTCKLQHMTSCMLCEAAMVMDRAVVERRNESCILTCSNKVLARAGHGPTHMHECSRAQRPDVGLGGRHT